MANCHICDLLPICPFASPVEIVCSSFKPKRKTNADRIRAMTDEELAKWITEKHGCARCPGWNVPCGGRCEEYWLDWLKEEGE